MKAKVGAKVNLSLAVTGKRGGLHTLDMRVCSVSLYDTAEIIGGDGARFEWASVPQGFVKEMFEPRLNEIYSALKAKFGGDFRFRFRKGIPSGAGLGGSSALAAAMAKLWTRGTGKSADDGFLLSLGSDVPYMYRGGEARVTGCGESVERRPFVARKVLVAFPEGAWTRRRRMRSTTIWRHRGRCPKGRGVFQRPLRSRRAAQSRRGKGEEYAFGMRRGARRYVGERQRGVRVFRHRGRKFCPRGLFAGERGSALCACRHHTVKKSDLRRHFAAYMPKNAQLALF